MGLSPDSRDQSLFGVVMCFSITWSAPEPLPPIPSSVCGCSIAETLFQPGDGHTWILFLLVHICKWEESTVAETTHTGGGAYPRTLVICPRRWQGPNLFT